jgi:hypothetical protein
MPSLLASPRRRRRLAWTLGSVVALVAAVLLGIEYSNTGTSLETPLEREVAATTTTAAARPLRVTPALRREVGETVQRFVHTAVIRKNLAAGWPLASPAMRAGVTRSEWMRGDIPVQPYPAGAIASADWRLVYRVQRTLGIDVMVQPKPRSGARVLVYTAELTAPGSGPPRRFLVDSWITQATLGAASGPGEPEASGTREQTEAAPELSYDEGRLGPEWFLVPAAIVLVLIGTVGGLAVRGVLVRRRAERDYRAQRRTG